METIKFRDFANRSQAGFWALGSALLLWALIFGVQSCSRSHDNEIRSAANKETMQKWREELGQTKLWNAMVHALQKGSTAGVRGFDERSGRYAELMLRLIGNFTPEERVQAYCYYKGISRLPDDTTVFILSALKGRDLSPELRVRLMVYGQDASALEKAVLEWVNSNEHHPAAKPLPPRPRLKPHIKPDWMAWSIFAIALYGLVNLVMAIGYFYPRDDYYHRLQTAWSMPVNLGSWLVMLVYAPAFAAPWAAVGSYFWLLRPIGRGARWVFADFSIQELAHKVGERRERKRTERQRRAAEEQMAIAEQARVGADVAALRIELKAFLEQAKLVQDKAEREQLIERLIGAERKLESTARGRAGKTKTSGDVSAGIAGGVEDIATRIDALYESENI